MRQGICATIARCAVFVLAAATPALAHPDPGTEGGAIAYLIAAGITVALLALVVWGGRFVAMLRSAGRRR